MDGYYLIRDWLEVPNLRSRAASYWGQHVRWLLWGADRPQRVAKGRVLLAYGFGFWVFATFFLGVLLKNLTQWVGHQVWGFAFGTLLTSVVSKRVFKGLFASELTKMITTRRWRTAIWVLVLGSGLGGMFVVPWHHTATGNFQVRPGTRSEVHAAVPGFIDR